MRQRVNKIKIVWSFFKLWLVLEVIIQGIVIFLAAIDWTNSVHFGTWNNDNLAYFREHFAGLINTR